MNQRHRIAIGLGANLGDRAETLKKAAALLAEDLLEDAKASSLYESKPWGITDQPDFLNAVMTGYTDFKPPAIVNLLKEMERALGRTVTIKNGPRVIDLDLICYGEEVWNLEGVQVPHPGMAQRDFVLLPLSEVWPEWKDPKTSKSVKELLATLHKTEPLSSSKVGVLPLGTKTP